MKLGQLPYCHPGTPVLAPCPPAPSVPDEHLFSFSSVHFSSVTQSCPTLCDPMNCSMPGLPVHHQLPEFTLFSLQEPKGHLLCVFLKLSQAPVTEAPHPTAALQYPALGRVFSPPASGSRVVQGRDCAARLFQQAFQGSGFRPMPNTPTTSSRHISE